MHEERKPKRNFPRTVYRRLLKMALEELRLIDEQIGQLDQEMASLLSQHQDAVERLAEVPGLGVDSAQQIIAEVGPTAATFPSEKCLSSWVGAVELFLRANLPPAVERAVLQQLGWP